MIWPFRKKTQNELLAKAEYHRARAEVYEALETKLVKIPSAFIMQIAADRGLEAEYQKLAEVARPTDGGRNNYGRQT